MDKIQKLEQRIIEIEERNLRVELDKRWEGSLTRKGLLAFFTYTAVTLYFLVIGIRSPFLNSVVPTVGFLLSTLSLPFFKRIWIEKMR